MKDEHVLLTQEGYDKLKAEYDYLRLTRRQEVINAIKVAKAFGDLSENSEYDEAKNEQAEVEHKIAELEVMLKNVKIIEKTSTSVISMGSTVKIYDCEFEEEMTYTIVGSAEANLDEGQISDESPIGHALLGKKAGDIVDVETPGGVIKIEVLEIQ
ncbi:MAG: transcription elongation factor GreA [Ruminococcaceae bacterium]|nr:transcription elongation factor GreA [Oscillospiraceae bacterium]